MTAHNGQATGFRCEPIHLIGVLPHSAKETFNGIGGANGMMHDRREGIQRQEMLFIFYLATRRFGIDLAVFAFERDYLGQSIFFRGQLPAPSQPRSQCVLFSLGDGFHGVALRVEDTALARRGREEGCKGHEQFIMSVVAMRSICVCPMCLLV